MGSWGFIVLAYGVGAVALLAYFVALKGRLREAREMLAVLERGEGRRGTGR